MRRLVKCVRILLLLFGWSVLTFSCILFYASCGLAWIGEGIMNMAFEIGDLISEG